MRRIPAGILRLAALAGTLGGLAGCARDIQDLRSEGVELYRGRQHIESMAVLREALDLAPSDAQSNYYMGLNYRVLANRKFRDGDITAARRDLDTSVLYFDQAIKSWPNYLAAVEARSEALELRGKYDHALDTANFVADNNRGGAVQLYIYAGDQYRDRGDYDNALRRYKMALAADPNSASAYAAMGKLFLRVGDRAKARDALSRAYELNPRDTSVADQLAALGMEGPEVYTATSDPATP
ncbi:MAG: hypothetical protein AMXMBFR13_42150 [Phycisphaerae bacterium]